MRVVSGSARGCKLFSPEGMDTRPTIDRIKETLFNIISPEIYDCNFLDIFSGSGAIGIEALSRGAKKSVFLENAQSALKIIDANLEKTKLKENAVVLHGDALNTINTLKEKFDIVFMDPPYGKNFAWPIMKAIRNNKLLNKDGIVIVEESANTEIPEIDGFRCYRTKEYKTTIMSFWVLEDNND